MLLKQKMGHEFVPCYKVLKKKKKKVPHLRLIAYQMQFFQKNLQF